MGKFGLSTSSSRDHRCDAAGIHMHMKTNKHTWVAASLYSGLLDARRGQFLWTDPSWTLYSLKICLPPTNVYHEWPCWPTSHYIGAACLASKHMWDHSSVPCSAEIVTQAEGKHLCEVDCILIATTNSYMQVFTAGHLKQKFEGGGGELYT